jgi:hypothetical protein
MASASAQSWMALLLVGRLRPRLLTTGAFRWRRMDGLWTCSAHLAFMDAMSRIPDEIHAQLTESLDFEALIEQLIDMVTTAVVDAANAAGLITREEVRAFVQSELRRPLLEAAGAPLAKALRDVALTLVVRSENDAQILTDPRYANVPHVTSWLHLKATDGERSVTVDSRKVTIPAGWLARQDRYRLQDACAWDADREWTDRELELIGEHDGDSRADRRGQGVTYSCGSPHPTSPTRRRCGSGDPPSKRGTGRGRLWGQENKMDTPIGVRRRGRPLRLL